MSASTATTFATAPPRATASVRHLPVNLFAAVMGLSGLALAWRFVQAQYGVGGLFADAVGWFAVGVFLVLAGGYVAKALRYSGAVKAEFSHPIAGNFFGTIAISLLLLSAVLGAHSSALGQAVWVLGTLLTLALSFHVVSRLLRGLGDATHAVPAWLIPGVATLDIAVTAGHMPAWAGEVVLFATAVGSVLALVMFTMIGTRLIQHEPLSGPMTPSLMILVAPFEVGFLAYVNLSGGTVDRFAALLFYFGLFIFLVVAPKVFTRRIAFGPTWWAIGFPLAALVNAALKYATVHPVLPLEVLAGALLVFLTVAIGVLTVRTAHSLVKGRLLAG